MNNQKERTLHCYHTEDGRVALTQYDLNYAINDQGYLALASVRGDDAKTLNLIADPEFGYLLSKLYGREWSEPENVVTMSDQQRLELPYFQHCAVMAHGKIYVRNGKFVTLEKFIKNASTYELASMLWDVAAQAALAQLAMSSGNKDDTTEAV